MESDQPPKISLLNPQTKSIMDNIFKNSIILNKANPSTGTEKSKKHSLWKEIVKKVKNLENLIKYNSINFNSQLDIDKNTLQVHFFSHYYSLTDQKEQETFIEKLSSLLYFSYRSNFPPITHDNEAMTNSNSNSNCLYTSDCGWGCMIRSSQMILSRALYKILKRKYPSKKENVLLQCLFYFFDFPCDVRDLPDIFLSVLAQYNSNIRAHDEKDHSDNKDKPEIKSVISPFSLRTICSVGQLFNKTAGNWFSDFHLPQIFNLINREFDVISDLSIMHFQGFVNKSSVIRDCFTELKLISKTDTDTNTNTETKDNIINLDDVLSDSNIQFSNKTYSLTKAGLIFISTRLGLEKVSPDYYDSINQVFNCKQFMGFIGGKGVMAYYFFGYDTDHFLYLDPHFNQEASPHINDELLYSYLPKKIYQLKYDKLQTCLTFGFLFRDVKEYTMLFDWLSKYSQCINPCFTVVDEVCSVKVDKDDMINFEQDDF